MPLLSIHDLLTLRSKTLGDLAADYEYRLSAEDTDVSRPRLLLVTIDPGDTAAALDSIELGYTDQQVVAMGGTVRRGQWGRFVASMGATIAQVPAPVLSSALPEFTPGHRLLFAAFAAETFHTNQVPHYATDYELDIPEEQRWETRDLTACDGLGSVYHVSRRIGVPGAPEMWTMPCRADRAAAGRFVHQVPEDAPVWVGEGSLVPWGLDVLARACRAVFEGGETCSDGSHANGADGAPPAP